MLARRSLGLILATLPILVTFAPGCSAPIEDDDAESVLAELTAQGAPQVQREQGAIQGAGHGGGVIQPINGYIADVTAAGSGCPAGSWTAAISPDGQTFTLYFSAYEAKVSPGQMFDMKQCVLNIGMRDPRGGLMSFVVGSFYHQGYVLLDSPGMRASRNATYTFGGQLADGPHKGQAAPPQHSEIAGPYDSSYLLTDNVFSGRWSACSRVSNLVINTNLMLQNNVLRTGAGYLNHSTVDGAVTLAFRLAWRRC